VVLARPRLIRFTRSPDGPVDIVDGWDWLRDFPEEIFSSMPESLNRSTVFVLLGSALYLSVNLFTFKGVPFLLDGDQVYYWTYGLRMLHGERMYLDLFSMRPPGTGLFYSTLFALFGERVWVTNLTVLTLGMALCWTCFHIASSIAETRCALLAAALFLVLVYGKLLNATHHWFSVLAIMGAVATILPSGKLWRIALAGSLLGVASFFTQTRGPFALLGLAAFILWDWRVAKNRWSDLLGGQLVLLFSFIATLAALSSYFIATTGFGTLWYFQITFVREHLVNAGSLGLPESLSWRRLPFVAQYLWIYISLPIVYAISLYRCWRGPAVRNWRAVTLLALVGLSLLAEVAFNLNWLRVFAVSMPGVILLVWIASELQGARRYVVAAAWLVLLSIGLLQIRSKHANAVAVLELPAGQVAIRSQTYDKLNWLVQHTRPGDFFFQAAWTSLYLPLKLRSPVFLDVLESSAVTTPPYVDLTIQQLEMQPVRYILWPPRLNAPDPFYGGVENYHLAPFRDYLRNHYHLLHTFPDSDEIWERNSP
jgi:hypothetical protein